MGGCRHPLTFDDVNARHFAGAVAHEQQGQVSGSFDEFLLFLVEAGRER